MDLHQLYVFTKVVEHKSFSKAAEAIFLSQSTVSTHIQSLEKLLNVNLFDRIGRESVLTPYGERLYHWALKLLFLKDQALLDINHEATDFYGEIRMCASTVPGQFLVPKMVKQFRETYPNAKFHISQAPSKIVSEKVLDGTVDLGIIGEKYENDKLEYFPLFKERLVLISSDAFPFNGPVRLESIIDYPLIMRNSDSGTNSIMERFFKKKRIPLDKLNVIAYTDCSQSLIQFVKEGIGVAIISEIAARGVKTNQLHIHPLADFSEERYFYLVIHKNKTQSMLAKLFIDTITLNKKSH
ncbi:selenium metabolism-associated LysR family transcriptional regulator [Pseudoneobacillus sp. C159]